MQGSLSDRQAGRPVHLPRAGAGERQRPRQRLFSIKEELFADAVAAARRRDPGVEMQAGLRGVQLLDWADSTLHLEVPHAFSRGLFERRVRPVLEAILSEMAGTAIRVRLHVAEASPVTGRRRLRSARARRMTLGDFIEDDGNRLAYRVVMEYRSGRPLFDPTFLYGPPRAGKTHLLRGFLEVMRGSAEPGAVVYMTAPVFGRAYRANLYRRRLPAFREEMTGSRLLILDEVHRLRGAPGTQEELVKLLERRAARRHATILASRHHPERIEGLGAALRSRCLGGMVLRVAPLSRERLIGFLKQRLLKRGLRLAPAILARAVEVSDGHPVTAETVLLEAVRTAQERRRPVTPEAILPLAEAAGEAGLDWRRLRRAAGQVAGFFGVSPADLRSPRKVRRALVPRRLLALVLREVFALTSAEIGRYLGGRSVSTVTVMLRQARHLVAEDASMRELVDHLASRLREESERAAGGARTADGPDRDG